MGFSPEGEKKSGGEDDQAKSGVVERKIFVLLFFFVNKTSISRSRDVAVGATERGKSGQRARYRALCEGKTATDKFSISTYSPSAKPAERFVRRMDALGGDQMLSFLATN